jgi:hypothetical protein
MNDIGAVASLAGPVFADAYARTAPQQLHLIDG